MPNPRFDPGLLVDRDVWLFFLAGVVLLTGSSAGVVWGVDWLQGWAVEMGAGIYLVGVVVGPALALAWLLGAAIRPYWPKMKPTTPSCLSGLGAFCRTTPTSKGSSPRNGRLCAT